MFSPKWYLMGGDIAVSTSTTRLDTLEFVEYTEKCRMWATEYFGLNIPLPGEVSVAV
jgi:hypothetical protein